MAFASSSSSIIAPSGADNEKDKEICRICRRQFSKYTCPSCNVPYCSLICFRSEAHSACSEPFFKKELETGILTGSQSKTTEERKNMMELLKKFEEDQARDDEFGSLEDDEDGEDTGDETDLAKRLADVDLETASPTAIWTLLSPVERTEFLKSLQDPSTSAFLANEAMESDDWRMEPWWEDPGSVSDGDGDRVLADEKQSRRRRFGEKPTILPLPLSLLTPLLNQNEKGKGRVNAPLSHNLCAICIAYAYVTRHLTISPLSSPVHSSSSPLSAGDRGPPQDEDTRHESRLLFARLVPFLTARDAATLYKSVPEVVVDMWARFEKAALSPQTVVLLLQDTAELLRPRRVLPLPAKSDSKLGGRYLSKDPKGLEDDISRHPNQNTVLVLSDVFWLFQSRKKSNETSEMITATQRKLQFYAAHVLNMDSSVLRSLVDEVEREAVRLKEEGEQAEIERRTRMVIPKQRERPEIVELETEGT